MLLGYRETARALHRTGATLYLTVRDVKKGEEVVADIKKSNAAESTSPIHLLRVELDSLESVRAGAKEFVSKSNKLNILINNAGECDQIGASNDVACAASHLAAFSPVCAGVMACPQSKTKDGFETQIGVNHFAHFLLFELLKSTLLASSSPAFASRVVNVASSGHRFSCVLLDDLNFASTPYNQWAAYGSSKCANVWMANGIERRYGAHGLHAHSLMPGGIATPLQRHCDAEDSAAHRALIECSLS